MLLWKSELAHGSAEKTGSTTCMETLSGLPCSCSSLSWQLKLIRRETYVLQFRRSDDSTDPYQSFIVTQRGQGNGLRTPCLTDRKFIDSDLSAMHGDRTNDILVWRYTLSLLTALWKMEPSTPKRLYNKFMKGSLYLRLGRYLPINFRSIS